MTCTEKSLHKLKPKMCKKRGKYQNYSDDFRMSIVKEYLSGGISKYALCKKYSIPSSSTLNSWLRIFVGDSTTDSPMKRKEADAPLAEDLSAEVARLKKELKDAKLALYQSQMRADAYDTMIDVAEDMFKIPIRKKAGTKQ